MISPADPDFDRRVLELLPGRAVVLDLKPFLAIVSNRSAHAIVAYTIAFEITGKNGKHIIEAAQSKAPEAVAGIGKSPFAKGVEICAGEDAVVGLAFDGVPPSDETLRHFAAQQSEEASGMETLQISLDAVILDDGTLFGPDTTKLRRSFAVYLQAHQDLYRRLHQSIEGGASVETAYRALTALFDLPSPPPGDEPAVYANITVGDAVRWRKRYGDDAVPALVARAIRDKPFLIRRPGDRLLTNERR